MRRSSDGPPKTRWPLRRRPGSADTVLRRGVACAYGRPASPTETVGRSTRRGRAAPLPPPVYHARAIAIPLFDRNTISPAKSGRVLVPLRDPSSAEAATPRISTRTAHGRPDYKTLCDNKIVKIQFGGSRARRIIITHGGRDSSLRRNTAVACGVRAPVLHVPRQGYARTVLYAVFAAAARIRASRPRPLRRGFTRPMLALVRENVTLH